MYKEFFGISESPFSIVPSARFLYLSDRHREALTHMLGSMGGGGGFGLLTGEVGTGKTTVLRALVPRLPQATQVAVILNPSLSTHELLAALSDELTISYPEHASIKILTDGIYQHLLTNHQAGKQTLLLIDEAQHLMPDVLEQLRLLTNLETDSTKLLKVVLVGQPELQQLLQQERLRQLAQRITSRYHLLPLTLEEVSEYINYRLRVVDCLHQVFAPAQTQQIAKATGGIPRLINLVCDKAMQLAYQKMTHQIDKEIVAKACDEILSWQLPAHQLQQDTVTPRKVSPALSLALGVAVALGVSYWQGWLPAMTTNTAAEAQVAPSVAAPQRSVELPPQVPVQAAQDPKQAAFEALQHWQETVKQAGSERHAMQVMYQLWGYETHLNQANCESSGRVALSCYSGKGNLEQLGLINRPAILALQEPDGAAYFATLYAIRRDTVELLLAGERIAVSPRWLAERWNGLYTLLWRPPLGDKTAIRYGQQGQRVAWLDRHLSSLLGVMPEQQDTFGQGLLDKLRRFQRAQDLSVDGIAGPRTLMVIDSALNLPGPTLQPERS